MGSCCFNGSNLLQKSQNDQDQQQVEKAEQKEESIVEHYKRHLHDFGYFSAQDAAQVLPLDTWGNLMAYYNTTHATWKRYETPETKNAHYLASHLTFGLTIIKRHRKASIIIPEEAPEEVIQVVKGVVESYCLDGHYNVSFLFFDDVAAVKAQQQQSENEQIVLNMKLKRLFWHQDKTSAVDNTYLFFAILDCVGVITRENSNLLQIACVPLRLLTRSQEQQRLAFNVDITKEDEVKELEKIEGLAGACYMINEDFRSDEPDTHGIVHSHTQIDFEGPNIRRAKVIIRMRKVG
jgi:hypothetical protein